MTAGDSVTVVTVNRLKQILESERGEFSLLDVGEHGQYGSGHVLRACSAPYSVLEQVVPALVPRRHCRIFLIDHGNDIAARAARRLVEIGYRNVSVVHGGTAAWAAAGLPLFEGVYVPSKAFGEWVEQAFHTPSVSADELRLLRDRGEVVVLDPRTRAEHAARHVPGAISCPGAELLYRFRDLVPSAHTQVVVACGGRTRGIIGAQTLIDAGITNPVASLEDGNHGWQLAGLMLEEGSGPGFTPAGKASIAAAVEWATALQANVAIDKIDTEILARWQQPGQQQLRTTYVLDVRDSSEFAQGHWPGARNAPGGQLIQATDRWLATWGARVVLSDLDGVRATTTAHWLKRMGWEVYVLASSALSGIAGEAGSQATSDAALPTGSVAADAAADVALHQADVAAVSPELPVRAIERYLDERHLETTPVVLDLSPSAAYLHGSPYGKGWRAEWASRAALHDWRDAIREGRPFILFSTDGQAARLAAKDVAEMAGELGIVPHIIVAEGGVQAWTAEGLPLRADEEATLAPERRLDVLYWASERRRGNKEAMRLYLDWEKQLLSRVQRAEPTFPLRVAHLDEAAPNSLSPERLS